LYLLCRLDINLLLLILGYGDSSGDKSKRSVVEIKGRFSVTSENVDLAKVSDWVDIQQQQQQQHSLSVPSKLG